MDVLPPGVAPPDAGHRNEAGGFCGLRRFADDATYPAAANRLTSAITVASGADSRTTGALRTCLDEILENVVHHAEAAVGGVALCQSWTKRQQAEVVILDRGRGVLASLRASATADDPAGHADALRDALTLGVTATPERNAGMGLAFSRALVLANGGDLEMRSGDAVVAASDPRQDQKTPFDFRGTAVRVTIRTDRPLDAAAAYAALDDLPL